MSSLVNVVEGETGIVMGEPDFRKLWGLDRVGGIARESYEGYCISNGVIPAELDMETLNEWSRTVTGIGDFIGKPEDVIRHVINSRRLAIPPDSPLNPQEAMQFIDGLPQLMYPRESFSPQSKLEEDLYERSVAWEKPDDVEIEEDIAENTRPLHRYVDLTKEFPDGRKIVARYKELPDETACILDMIRESSLLGPEMYSRHGDSKFPLTQEYQAQLGPNVMLATRTLYFDRSRHDHQYGWQGITTVESGARVKTRVWFPEVSYEITYGLSAITESWTELEYPQYAGGRLLYADGEFPITSFEFMNNDTYIQTGSLYPIPEYFVASVYNGVTAIKHRETGELFQPVYDPDTGMFKLVSEILLLDDGTQVQKHILLKDMFPNVPDRKILNIGDTMLVSQDGAVIDQASIGRTRLTHTFLHFKQQAPTDATVAPTTEATVEPTDALTEAPTDVPTGAPTDVPTEVPTDAPTDAPTDVPTEVPTDALTEALTGAPTDEPTDALTEAPTGAPTDVPTEVPTDAPVEQIIEAQPKVLPEQAAPGNTFSESLDSFFNENSAGETTSIQIGPLFFTRVGASGTFEFVNSANEITLSDASDTTQVSIPPREILTLERRDNKWVVMHSDDSPLIIPSDQTIRIYPDDSSQSGELYAGYMARISHYELTQGRVMIATQALRDAFTGADQKNKQVVQINISATRPLVEVKPNVIKPKTPDQSLLIIFNGGLSIKDVVEYETLIDQETREKTGFKVTFMDSTYDNEGRRVPTVKQRSFKLNRKGIFEEITEA